MFRQILLNQIQCSQYKADNCCSRDCQDGQWKTHKKECKLVQIFKAVGADVHEKLGLGSLVSFVGASYDRGLNKMFWNLITQDKEEMYFVCVGLMYMLS